MNLFKLNIIAIFICVFRVRFNLRTIMSEESDSNSSLKHDSTHISNESATRILSLLKAGEEKIDFKSHRDVVLILGNTGSGKTTFTQFIAGDNNRMVSREVRKYTGEFIISDFDNKISSNSTITSKTTFPELFIDPETKIVYIDNPGFNDSRNEAYDITAAYFIKKVFDSVQNVKIVLITSYPSVRKGVNRTDFLQLLEHVTVLLKDIDKYVDSIALVTTKVDNAFVMCKGVPELIPDYAIIENIADFVLEVRESLEQIYISEPKRLEDKAFYKNAIKLLNALLTKKDSHYSRLGIFRRPNEPGIISQIQLLQNDKKKIINMVRQNIRYLPSENAFIGYTISEKSRNVIRDLVAEVNNNIITDVAVINVNLINYFCTLERDMLSHDFHTLRNHLKTASKALSNISSIEKSVSATEFIKCMSKIFDTVGVQVSKSHLHDIINLNKFLIFLQHISAKKYDSSVWKWIKELNPLVGYIDNALKWYNFLVALHDQLSQYVVQKNKTSYHIPTFDAIGDQTLRVEDLHDISTFLNAIGKNSVLETVYYDEIKQVRLDDVKLRFFSQILQVTLNDNTVYESLYGGQCVRVIGEYILLSEVTNNKAYKSCQLVQIFATHTAFVDGDLSKTDEISILAPRWEIIGTRTISLNGRNGLKHESDYAEHGKWDGKRGEDGLPGFPGQPGGRFIGIGNEFKNISNLSIMVNGGCGGPGQHGGNGAQGASSNTIPDRNYCECWRNLGYVSSIPGGRGGDGGCGGAGGAGGIKGELITIDTSNSQAFSTSLKTANNGDNGTSGSPGKPGVGGNGYRLMEKLCYCYSLERKILYVELFANGEYGSSSHFTSQVGMKLPVNRVFLCTPSLIISDYLNKLLKNLYDCVKHTFSLRFYEEILQNAQLDVYHDVNTLSCELQSLEEHHYRLNVNTSVILYECILNKIFQAAQSRPNQSTALECLRLTITSKLHRLKVRPKIHTSFNLEKKTWPEIKQPPFLTFLPEALDSLIENNITSSIERIDAQIVELSYPPMGKHDDLPRLGDLLLERKLLGDLRMFTEFLQFLCMLVEADLKLMREMLITEILPCLRYQMTGAQTVIDEIDVVINEFQSKVFDVLEALRGLISTQSKTYQRSREFRNDVVEHLQDVERKLRSTMHTCFKDFSTNDMMLYFAHSMEKLRVSIVNENGIGDLNVDEIEMMNRIDVRRKFIEFDFQLYKKMKYEMNIVTLVKALDNVLNSTSEKRSCLGMVESLIIPVLKIIRANITGSYDFDKMAATRAAIFDFLNSTTPYFDCISEKFANSSELLSTVQNLVEMVKILRDMFEVVTCVELKMRLRKLRQRDTKEEDFKKFHTFMRKDSLLYEYEFLIDAFKRTYFPFDILDSETFTIPTLSINADQSVDDLKKSIENNLNALGTILDNQLKSSPEFVCEKNFDANSDQGPLFQWKNTSYAENIANLLRGKQIVLTASIDPNDHRHYLRFESVRLRFRTLNETTQASLNDALCNFKLHMIHSGRSSYVFCNQVYVIDEESCEYQHSHDAEAEIEHSRSPYAMWLFSLRPIDQNVKFSSLRPFIDEPVDLLLEGRAKYFKIEDKAAIYRKLEIDAMNRYYSTSINRRIVDARSSEGENDGAVTSVSIG